MSGTLRGASSADRVAVKDFRPALMIDSGAWKGGFSEDIMAGVRTRSFGCGGGCAWWCCDVGALRSGRKACVRRIGWRRRVLMTS